MPRPSDTAREWWARALKAIGGRRHLVEDLREEIEAHLELEIQDRIGAGMSPRQAQEIARRDFGNRRAIEERAHENRLFGLSPHDPATILLATVTRVAVTLAAGFLPALRASKVDPLIALRCE